MTQVFAADTALMSTSAPGGRCRGEETEKRRGVSADVLVEAMLSGANDVITLSSRESGRLIEVSDSFCTILGYARKELIGRTSVEVGLIGAVARDEMLATIADASGGVQEICLRCKDGSTLLVESSVLLLAGDELMLTTSRDITDRRAAELELGLRADLLDLAHDAVVVREPAKSQITFWNREAEKVYGYTRADAIGRVSHDLLATVFPESQEAVDEALAGEEQWKGVLRHTRNDGQVIDVSSRQAVQRDADGLPVAIIELNSDITERCRAQEQAVLQAALLDEIDVAVIVTDPDLRVVSWSAGAERLYEWNAEEAIGGDPSELEAPGAARSPGPALAALRDDGRWEGESMVRRKDGSTFPAYLRDRVMLDQDGRVKGLVSVSMDISERKDSERALLSARSYLRAVTDSMDEAVYATDGEGRLTYLNQAAQDLLGWPLKDARGHAMHDLVHNRQADGSPYPIEQCPIRGAWLDGRTVRVEDDIFIRRDGSKLPVAYTAAPFATDDAVEGCVIVFKDITARKTAAATVERDLEKLGWVDRIQAALNDGRFVLHAQPIIDLHTGNVVQCELLMRMRSPENSGELIAPGAFLPVAEEYGLITEIDRWVIDRSAEIAAAGQSVQVNVSARSISDPSLADYVKHALARTGADPATMVFEITETTLVSDGPAARAFVERLHELGCQVALDDFGTGYGGFTYLKQLPVDYLKIDIEFVRDLRENAASCNVVRGIVNLAHGFGLKTIGEGVEDQQTLDLLREFGVDYAQGYHIGRPSPLESRSPHHIMHRGQR
jgi:PAS domain S-box-containing protein